MAGPASTSPKPGRFNFRSPGMQSAIAGVPSLEDGLSSLGSGAGAGKADVGSIVNAGLGISSLIKGLTKKRPKPFTPSKYTPSVRPAQGNEEALQRTKNIITDQAGAATRDVGRIAGADANAGIAARLGIQDNATKALAAAEAENARLFQEDQKRASEEMNRANMINTQIENEAKEYNSRVDQSNFATNQAAAAQGVQSSLQYMIDRDANKENNQIAENNANQTMDAIQSAAYNRNYNEGLRLYGNDATRAKQHADDLQRRMNVSRFGIYRPHKSGLFRK